MLATRFYFAATISMIWKRARRSFRYAGNKHPESSNRLHRPAYLDCEPKAGQYSALRRDASGVFQPGRLADNSITFRFVYEPRLFTRTLSRITPTWNFVDDVSWVKGNHTWQFGTNIRTIETSELPLPTPSTARLPILLFTMHPEPY